MRLIEKMVGLGVALVMLAPSLALSQSKPGSTGFLSDYSKLLVISGDKFSDMRYVAPEAFRKLAKFDSVMIDQPEIFVSPDSKYKGLKPDEAKALADAIQEAVANELDDSYKIVTAPGPTVLRVRVALADVMLKKGGLGADAGAAKNIVVDDLVHKISLIGMTIEAEALDSTTNEQLVALISYRGEDKSEPGTWADLKAIIGQQSRRLACRLDNAHKPEAQWSDCSQRK
jgi:hypothetical protein